MEEALAIIEKSVRSMGAAFLAALPKLAVALVLLALTWVVVRVADRLARRALKRVHFRPSLTELFGKLLSMAVWAVGLMVSLSVVFPELTPSKILTVLGLGSVAIGFAFKDIFENFLAGVLVLWREPFRLHDFIECDGHEGMVERVTIRDTHLRQSDGQRVVLPNALLFKNPVTVRTDMDRRRTTVVCGVGYDEDLDRCRQLMEEALRGLDTVDPDRPVQVFAKELGPSSVDFEVTWWTGSSPKDLRASRDQVIAALKRILDGAGVEMPAPYRTLTFKEPMVYRRLEGEEAEGNGSSRPPGPGATSPPGPPRR